MNFIRVNIDPFLPTRACLKKTGPFESNLINNDVSSITGEAIIRPTIERIIDMVLFINLLKRDILKPSEKMNQLGRRSLVSILPRRSS